VAMGTTGYALAHDASAIATNPALLTEIEGGNFQTGLVVVTPHSTVKTAYGTSHTQYRSHVIPNAYYSQQMTDKVWLGVGEFTRFGLGNEYDSNWVGQNTVKKIVLKTFSFNPTVAFKFNDKFSAAVGVEIIKGDFEHVFANYKIVADGTAAAGNIGLLYKPTEQWNVGLTYRSGADFYGTGKLYTGGTTSKEDVSAALPGSFTFAVGYKPTDKLSLEADVVHTRWESMESLDYSGALSNSAKFDYKNTWRFQLGAEYALLDWLDGRVGFVFDQTPIRNGYASALLPSNDRMMYSTGLGAHWNGFNIDASVMYIDVKDRYGVYDKYIGNMDFVDGNTWVYGLSLGYAF